MAGIVLEHGRPSTLADVIQQVIDAFSATADPTPIMVGKQYLKGFAVGRAPRVLFVPETDGRVERASELGRAGRVVHGCQVLVRGEEGRGDVDRFRNAELLEAKVIGCLAVACSGRIEWADRADGSPADVDFGAELSFGFFFARDVPHDAARWALPPADLDTTGPQPRPPPGEAGAVDAIDVEIEPVEFEDEED